MMGRSLSEAAVWYAKNGFHVFPLCGIGVDGQCECRQANCKSPGKHPAPEVPRGFHNATNDIDRVRSIWTAKPNRNIGLSVGASGYGVVDIDCGVGKDGEVSLSKLIGKHGALPESWEVETGSGGRHIYFRADKFPTNTNSYGEPNVDTRGVGGYVVAPPSRHISGGIYRWKEGRAPDNHNLADAPQWLIKTAPSSRDGAGHSRDGGQNNITRSLTTGLVVDGRESYLRDITHAAFLDILNESGCTPDVIGLQARVWHVFSNGADLRDCRWSEKDAIKYARNIIKRYNEGKLNATPPTSKVVRDVAPSYPSAHTDGEGASQRLNKIIRLFLVVIENHILAKTELAFTSTSLEHLDSSERERELRKFRADLRKRYGVKCLKPPRLQMAAPAGLGKTSLFVQMYAQSPFLSGLQINYYVPTIERARELEAALHVALSNAGYVDAHSRVQVMLGRSDLKHGRCHEERKSLVASVEKKASSIYNTMCISEDASEGVFPVEVKCPFHGWCDEDGYLSQFKDKGPKLRIWPHAQLPLQQNKDLVLPDADLVVVDESCLNTLCKVTRFSMSELKNPRNFLGAGGEIDQSALEIGARILRTIKLEKGSLQLDPLTLADITSDDLRTAEAAARRAADRSALFVQPHWSPESIQMKAEEHQFNWGAIVAGVLGTLAASIEAGQKACMAVSLEAVHKHHRGTADDPNYELVWSRSSRPLVPSDAGLLLLDADANVVINRRLFGPELRHVTIRAKRRGYVKQVYTAPYANRTLSSPSGSGLRAKIKVLVKTLVALGKKVLIGCNLEVRRTLTGEVGKLPQSIDWSGASVTHFGAFIGSNAWENFDAIIVLGREQPPPTAVENIARALWPDEELDLPGQYMPEVRGYNLRNGERAGVEVAVHADPRVQMILELTRERASGQLIDRLRLMYPDDRQPEIILISNIPVPGLVVDELVTLDELLNGGSLWNRALAAVGGVLPLQSEYLAKMLPSLFPSVSTAARAVAQLHHEGWRRPSGTRIMKYRYVSSGPLSSALIAEGVDDIREQLGLSHGTELGQIVVQECQTAEPSHPANNIIRDLTGFVRLIDDFIVGVVPKPRSKGSWQVLARQLGKPADALRVHFSRSGMQTLDAAYAAPGSFWRLHLKGERYAVDVKLSGIAWGDQSAADIRLKLAGLEVSWITPMEPKRPSAKVLLFRPKKRRGEAVALNGHAVQTPQRHVGQFYGCRGRK